MSRTRAIDADDLSLKIDQTIDMACILGTNELAFEYPDEFEDFIDSHSPNSHASVKDMLDMMNASDSDSAREWLYRNEFFGVVMQIGTPVRKYSSEGSYRSNFGHCYIGWVYGHTDDEAWEQAKDWAKTRHAADLEKFTKGGAA